MNGLADDDTLIVVGDLYDFWFVSRQQRLWKQPCEAEASLLEFQRGGGQLRILSGNHDTWLGPFIEKTFGVPFEHEPIQLEFRTSASSESPECIRLHIRHGHLLSRRAGLKTFMESRLFLKLFSRVPSWLARKCDHKLQARNVAHFERQNLEQLEVFRKCIRLAPDPVDVYLFGHIHDRIEEQVADARLFVLGDWKEAGSYLKVDAEEIVFVKRVGIQ